MAEVDSQNVERSGFDPTAGSVLSRDSRNDLFRRFTIDSTIFRNELTSIENSRKQSDLENISAIQEQEKSLIGVNSNIQGLREDILKLGTGLATISLLLQQDNAEEQSRIRAEQESQRRLAERQIRIGKENEIEQRIQNAVLSPVQALAPKVNDIFGRIGSALGILFGGWLTQQVVDAMRASEEGNTKLLNDIKFNIIKNVGIAIGGLFAIRAGFSLIKGTISRIASGLTRLLIARPLAIAATLLPRGGKTPPPSAGPGPKPRGGGVMGGFGRLLTVLSTAMNAKNKEYTDTVLGALSLFAKAPGPLGLVAKVAGVAFTLDEIAEAFGKNIFGDDRDKIINDAAMAAKKELEKLKPQSTSSTKSKPEESTKPTPTAAQPQTPMMGPPAPATPTSPAVEAQPQTPMMGPPASPAPTSSAQPSADMVSKFEQAWQYRNNPLARGRIESAWNKMTPEEKQMAMEWAKTKGYDWNEMKLQAPAPKVSGAQQTAPESSQMVSSQQSASVDKMPAQISVPQTEAQKVGELPEPKPTLTMIKTSSAQNAQVNPPVSNGPLTDVPLINSANPDNFYVLYSYLNYNVVM
jgi:hypothetical protein